MRNSILMIGLVLGCVAMLAGCPPASETKAKLHTVFTDMNGDLVCDTCGFHDSDGNGACDVFVDENGDGVCDHCGFVDENGDGFSDNYVDGNNDGVCDYSPLGAGGGQGGYAHGYNSGLAHGWHQSTGNSASHGAMNHAQYRICVEFIDEDGDGVCDLCGFADLNRDWACDGFVDADNDGICDACGHVDADGDGFSDRFVDEDGDGVCDYSPRSMEPGENGGFAHGPNEGLLHGWHRQDRALRENANGNAGTQNQSHDQLRDPELNQDGEPNRDQNRDQLQDPEIGQRSGNNTSNGNA